MKQLIKKGIEFVNNNRTILSSLLLIFVVVAALFVNTYVIASRFQENIDKTLRTKAVFAENIFAMVADHYLTMPNGIYEFQSKLEEIQKKDTEIAQIDLYDFDVKNNTFSPVFRIGNTENTNDDPQQKLVIDNAKKFAASVDDAFAYVNNENGVRYWNVVRSIKRENSQNVGILLMKLSLSESDELIRKTINQAYIFSIASLFVVLLLVLNHIRLFTYEIKAKKLEEIDKMKDDFISMASHELKSPLTAIRGYSELISDALNGSDLQIVKETQGRYLKNIDSAVERLRSLVEDLLDVSRLEQNRLPFDNKPTDLAPIVHSVSEEMLVMAQQKNLQFVNNVKNTPLAFCDQERVKQIMINLVSNAIKYTSSGKVEISSKQDEKWIYVTVADTGLGISGDDLQNLFTKFHRIRTTRTAKITGTGLGLWIAREVALKMGGDILVESIEGVGSHFTLKLKKA